MDIKAEEESFFDAAEKQNATDATDQIKMSDSSEKEGSDMTQMSRQDRLDQMLNSAATSKNQDRRLESA